MSTLRSLAVFAALALVQVVSGLYDGTTDVKTFEKMSDFRNEVINGDGISLVQFYAPWCGHCKQFVPNYNQIGSLLKGVATVGAVDAASDGPQKRIASEYGITGFPTMKMFYNGKVEDVKSRDPSDIISGVIQSIQDLVQTRANGSGGGSGNQSKSNSSSSRDNNNSSSGSKVMQLTASNFDEKVYKNPEIVAVAFIAPWCGHCKALIPEWEEAAKKVHGNGAALGVVDATVEESLASEYGVQGFPTIKIFPGGVTTANSAMEYQGGRQSAQIVQYVLAEVDRSGVPKEIPELLSAKNMEETCASGICVFAALPHILDSGADGRNKYRDILTAASKSVRGMSFKFLWFEGTTQPTLENAFELTFGFPALAAYSMEKGVYAVHRSSFTESNIRKFLMGITTGKQPTYKIDAAPSIESVEAWDGLDGEVMEEEFSLEDIMGDDWEL
eukprot:195307_1